MWDRTDEGLRQCETKGSYDTPYISVLGTDEEMVVIKRVGPCEFGPITNYLSTTYFYKTSDSTLGLHFIVS